ncbi:MAG: DUF2023 family protein [Bacteroidales bacterium]|jgi:hypothetical protein|nr:DUF2023 family protein [Bacteroidales bacterium]
MKVLNHHIYEYKKGLRHLVLHTLDATLRFEAEARLHQRNISYVVREVTATKINIFFGDEKCVEVIREIGNKKLNEFTPEEDFMLGIMLGYDGLKQCERFLNLKRRKNDYLWKQIINTAIPA